MKNKQHKTIDLQKLTITKLSNTTIENIKGGSSLPPSEVVCYGPNTEIIQAP